MAEYINMETIMKFPIRKDHCDKEHANGHFINGIESVLEYVENLPAADVAPVRHGHWCWDGRFRACSICGSYVEFTETLGASHWKYCPHCGAKMYGGED